MNNWQLAIGSWQVVDFPLRRSKWLFFPKIAFVFGLIGLLPTANCQLPTAPDSLRFFSFDDFQEMVLTRHPVARQAALLPDIARAELLEARGLFDPKLATFFDRKGFKGIDYYNRFDGYLQVPTWFGVDLKAGYERNSGDRLTNPESPSLAYAGLSVPLAQGLLIDARRATIRQAQLGRNLAEADRAKLINKVLLDAAKTYWDWYFTHQQYRLAEEGFQLADVRYRAIAQRAKIGDLAAVDSIEARITRQDRLVQLQQATVERQNARLVLSNFLWDDADNPLELPETAQPGPVSFRTVDDTTLQRLVNQARAAHPELLALGYKLRQLDVQERFQRNQFLPRLNVNFNFLSEPKVTQENFVVQPFLVNNHKFGAEFIMPILWRKERGKLQQVQLKQRQLRLDQQQTSREILNDVQASYNDVKALEQQVSTQESAVRDQDVLLNAERRKFDLGESSVFLVNTRESKFLELRLKLENLRAKYEKALAQLAYAAGGARL
jgi:outer membrane protein TolC